MGEFKSVGKDAKDLFMGNDGSENEPDDFKTELNKSVKRGEITKADGTLLITARENVEKLRKQIEKSQENDIENIARRKTYDSPEEELEATKKREAKEQERKRKQRETEAAMRMNESSNKKVNQTIKNQKQKEREN